MKKGLTRAYIIVGAALPLFFLFSLVYDASTSTEESNPIDRLTELKLEQVELLSGINYHQTQLNTATVRLGKVETAIPTLEALVEEPEVGVDMEEYCNKNMDVKCASYFFGKNDDRKLIEEPTLTHTVASSGKTQSQ